mgnify:CR=1 FL=1
MSFFPDFQTVPTTSKAKFPKKSRYQKGVKCHGFLSERGSDDDEDANDSDKSENEGKLIFLYTKRYFCSYILLTSKVNDHLLVPLTMQLNITQ